MIGFLYSLNVVFENHITVFCGAMDHVRCLISDIHIFSTLWLQIIV